MRISRCFLLSFTLWGCAGAPAATDDPTSTVTIQASAQTLAELGIARWEVKSEAKETARFFGRDAQGGSRAELLIRPAGDNRLVESAPPGKEHVLVAPDGSLVGPLGDSFRRLVTARWPDPGTAQANLPGAAAASSAGPATPEPGVGGTVALEPSIAFEGHEGVWGGWFGVRMNFDVGNWCPNRNAAGPRSYYEAYSNNGASCWVNRWSSNHSDDCRINLHIGASPFWSDVCNWYVYQEP